MNIKNICAWHHYGHEDSCIQKENMSKKTRKNILYIQDPKKTEFSQKKPGILRRFKFKFRKEYQAEKLLLMFV